MTSQDAIPSALVAELFKEIQENALPVMWSQGVTLNRGGCSFLASSMTPAECVIQVRVAGQPVSPKVTLSPQHLEWDCDCGNPESPCSHVTAAVIALKRGAIEVSSVGSMGLGVDSGAVSDSTSIARIHYEFRRSPEGLMFQRAIVSSSGRTVFEGTLVAYKAGFESGRVKGPDVVASKADFAVDQALRNYRGTLLDRPRLEALFASLDSDQAIFLDEKPIRLSGARIMPRYECVDEADGYRLRRIRNPLITESFPRGVALCTDILHLMQPLPLTPDDMKLTEGAGSFWGPESEKEFLGRVLPALQKKIKVEISSIKMPQTLEIPPHVVLLLEKDKSPQGDPVLSIVANVVYGNPPIALLDVNTWELRPIQDYRAAKTSQVIKRDRELEREHVVKLSRELNLQVGRRVMLRGTDAVEFVRKARSWNPTGDGVMAFDPAARVLEAKVDVGEASFDVTFLAAGGDSGQTASFDAVFKAWQANADAVPLMDGSWARIPKDWLSRFGKKIQEFLVAREIDRDGKPETAVPTYRLPELNRLCDDLGVEAPTSLKRLRVLGESFTGIEEIALPEDLTTTLRPYQIKGVNWLCFLRQAGLGAMLADDMGLGKTLQMMCALQGRSLIVAPTSVLFNWAAEIKKFRPSLKVAAYYGGQRSLDLNADVVLTSYGVLRLDLERLRTTEWDTIVLDEAQVIKNPDSQVAKAAHALRGVFRATLSGTPVENRLDDLWSQFHFINPGLLGSREDFLERYARPIGRGENDAALKLKLRIKPFILRRLKKEVAADLPPRTEMVLSNELSADERATYDAIFAATRKEVVADLEGGGSILKALEAILRLRQACCHRALIPGAVKEGESETSSKVELLMETLDESLSEGHKSLVFSQWTSFLDKIAIELRQRGIAFSRIDGSTQNRQQLVEEFQGSGGPPIMLISLKAGGVGLTLTAADHVFIMDPWWNPAVEDQAADRAHRIGQQNPVMIHRLVARDTIEEKILLLQEKKKDLARAVLDEGGAALSLTRQDILDLLT